MFIPTPKSLKSPIMQEIRRALQAKPNLGEPTPSNQIARKIWREQFLGILSKSVKEEIAMKKTLLGKKQSLKRKTHHPSTNPPLPRTDEQERPNP